MLLHNAEDVLQAHTCQCTQCRKQAGSLVVNFITVLPSQLKWANPSSSTPQCPAAPFKEYSSSAHGRRGFCSECGSALTWRDERNVEEVELFVGTIDEVFLIGDRSTRVESDNLACQGKWIEVLRKEDKDGKTSLGKDLCMPQGGNFFFRNAVEGVTDYNLGGKWYVEDTAKGLVIPK